MSRGRPAKPIELHKLQGTFRSDRHGNSAWQPEGAPVKPEGLVGAAGDLWDSIVPQLVESGVATAADVATLLAMCEWWSRYRRAGEAVDGGDLDLESMRVCSLAWANFDKLAARFGLTPSDRAKLKLPVSTKPSAMALFARQRNGIPSRPRNMTPLEALRESVNDAPEFADTEGDE